MLLDTKIDRIQGSLKYVLIMFREAVIARITRLTPLSVEVILFMTVLMYPREVTSLRMLKSKAVQDTVDSIINYPREVTSLRMLKSKAVQDTVDSIIK